MPGLATNQFDFGEAFDLTSIRTYASWDSGRNGQGYIVNYATAAAPSQFQALHTVANWNNDDSIFPTCGLCYRFAREFLFKSASRGSNGGTVPFDAHV